MGVGRAAGVVLLTAVVLLAGCSSTSSEPPRIVHTTVGAQGVLSDIYLPPAGLAAGLPVLLIGGSEGGLAPSPVAEALVKAGHPTMAVAYFRGGGLPPSLTDVPLEYFVRAVALLHQQPGVSAGPVAIWGISRGSEAALLTGSYFPDLIGPVVADSPASTTHSAPPPFFGQPAWTLNGQPLPRVGPVDFGNPAPADQPDAVIPVQRSDSAFLTICGEADQTWPSCAFAQAIASRADTRTGATKVVQVDAPGVGHSFVSLGLSPDAPPAQAAAAHDALARALDFLHG